MSHSGEGSTDEQIIRRIYGWNGNEQESGPKARVRLISLGVAITVIFMIQMASGAIPNAFATNVFGRTTATVKVRSGPGITYGSMSRLAKGSQVRIHCSVRDGAWFLMEGVGPRRYLPARDVWTHKTPPDCRNLAAGDFSTGGAVLQGGGSNPEVVKAAKEAEAAEIAAGPGGGVAPPPPP